MSLFDLDWAIQVVDIAQQAHPTPRPGYSKQCCICELRS